jgi:hypothetical protein
VFIHSRKMTKGSFGDKLSERNDQRIFQHLLQEQSHIFKTEFPNTMMNKNFFYISQIFFVYKKKKEKKRRRRRKENKKP